LRYSSRLCLHMVFQVINWVAFGPNGDYVMDTADHLYASSDTYARTYKSGSRVPLRSMSFGHGHSWVTIEDDGEVRSGGLNGTLKAALEKKEVRVSASSQRLFEYRSSFHPSRFDISMRNSARRPQRHTSLSMSMATQRGRCPPPGTTRCWK
jgi:hypothetical protein